MSFAVMFGKLVVLLAKSDCMHVIRKLASDPDVESGLHGKEELKAIEAVRRIVEEFGLLTATWLILNESNAKGELVAEPKKRKYQSEATSELWDEGRALLEDEDENVLATDEQKSIEQEQYGPSSPSYSPTAPVYSVPACWADDL